MRSCLKKLHQDMQSDEIIEILLTNDYRLTVRKNEKVTSSGNLIVIIRKDGRRVVINPNQILFFFTKEAY